MQQLRDLDHRGIQRIIHGPIPFRPDGEPILGPAPEMANAWLAVGFSSGVAASGGAGKVLAEWIIAGAPEAPVPSLDPRRFGLGRTCSDAELLGAAIAAYGGCYALASVRNKPRV